MPVNANPNRLAAAARSGLPRRARAGERPGDGAGKPHVVMARMDATMHTALRVAAAENDCAYAEIIRELVSRYLGDGTLRGSVDSAVHGLNAP